MGDDNDLLGEMPKLQRSESSGSTITDPDADPDTSRPSSPPRATSADPRTSLQHLLAQGSSTPTERDVTEKSRKDSTSRKRDNGGGKKGEKEDFMGDDSAGDGSLLDQTSVGQSAPNSTNRRAGNNGTASSVYSGNKMKNIKKDDGVPLWRKDIQYDFLRAIFEDDKQVFTNILDGRDGYTFADLYVDAMARSSKTSKILKDKLLTDRAAAANMAMVCLLVNVGRMNTTLNFFPEMRAQLRTYHAIPCLQAHQDSSTYKQLQDAPRLKSILKGASEEKQEPTTLEKLKLLPKPRTNPVHLIFLLTQYAPKLSELHFSPQLDFFDLITRTTLSSRSRAQGFLWLMWWYLESDFTPEDAERNPFGPGQPPEVDGVNQKLPKFEYLTEEQAAMENVDTEEEFEYGYKKQEERRQIIENEVSAVAPTMRRAKKTIKVPSEDRTRSPLHEGMSPLAPRTMRDLARSKPRKLSTMESNHSDTDLTRSQSPSNDANGTRPSGGMRIINVLNEDQAGNNSTPSTTNRPSRSRPTRDRMSTQRLIFKSKNEYTLDQPSPGSLGSLHDGNHPRRSRPLTAHQIAVERNRQERIEYLLDRRMRNVFAESRKIRKREGAMWRAWMRHESMTNPFENSEDEGMQFSSGKTNHIKESSSKSDNNHTFGDGDGGTATSLGGLSETIDRDDYGEEVATYAAAIRRTARRLERWENGGGGAAIETGKGKGKQQKDVTKKIPNGTAKQKPPPPAPPAAATVSIKHSNNKPEGRNNNKNNNKEDSKSQKGKGKEKEKAKRSTTRRALSPVTTGIIGRGGGGGGRGVVGGGEDRDAEDTEEAELDDTMDDKEMSMSGGQMMMEIDTEEDDEIEEELLVDDSMDVD